MNMKNIFGFSAKGLLVVFLLVATAVFFDVPPASASYVPRDISLTTTNPHTNPYLDVWVKAVFAGPSKIITLDGFWDGGNVWKIRFAPTEPGLWSYTTQSNDPQLNGKNGQITALNSGREGFVVLDPDNAFAFGRSNGGQIFLMGDTFWNGMSNVGGILDYSTFKDYMDIRAGQKFNFIRSYVLAIYQSSVTPEHYNEGGRAFEPWDPDSINPGYFKEVDRRIAYANSKGIAVHLLVGSDGTNMTGFFGWGNGKMERWVRYLAARYSAYDISWEGRAEYEEQGSVTPGYLALAGNIGSWIQTGDPYGHIQSMHTLDSNNELGNENWLDWIMHQSRDWLLITRDRSYGKPVMNEEFYYEDGIAEAAWPHHVDADTVRKGAWQVITHGASGLAYGNSGTYSARSQTFAGLQYATSDGAMYMTYLYDFFQNTEFWKLSPNDSLASSGRVLASAGGEYVIYLQNGGSTTVNLSAAAGTLSVEWYNPRNGALQGQSSVQGGASRMFTAPDLNDWALHIYASTQPPQNSPPEATITAPSSTTTTVNLGSTINFSANVSDPNSSTINMKWYIDRMGDGILWALIKEENKAPGTTSGTVTMSGTRTNTDGQTISLQDVGATYELVLEVSDGVNDVVTTKRVFTLTSSTPTNTLCHLLTSSNTTPTGYGASYNVLSTAKELLMNVLCNTTSATITIGNNSQTQYIYNKGYIYRNPSAGSGQAGWQQVSYSCSNLVSSAWCVGNANATIPLTSTEMASTNYILGYVCSWNPSANSGQGLWQCGCRDNTCTTNYWNLQEFKR